MAVEEVFSSYVGRVSLIIIPVHVLVTIVAKMNNFCSGF